MLEIDFVIDYMLSDYIKLIESFKTYQISKLIKSNLKTIFAALKSPQFNPKIAPYFRPRNRRGEPFTHYEQDPDTVSQVKKIINALYHAQNAFRDLENIDLNNFKHSLKDLKKFYSHTIHEAYQACYLATHLDVNVKELFQEEFGLLFPLIIKLQNIAKKHTPEMKALTLEISPNSYKKVHNLGAIIGTAVEQVQPSSGSYDYSFLTQFSAALPTYIDQLTLHISKFSSQILPDELTLNHEKMDELQVAGYKLLNELEHLKSNSLFISLKFINYIHIIRNIYILAMSSLEQMSQLNDSSKKVILDKLAQLKYILLPKLLGLVDNIEINTMRKPGTLSQPLMKKIEQLYAALIYYIDKVADVAANREELLSLHDAHFTNLRLDHSYHLIDQAHSALFKLEHVKQACTDFYSVLEEPTFNKLTIEELSQETKNNLIQNYKLLQPYLIFLDSDLNEKIIYALQRPASYLPRWVSGLTVKSVLSKKNELESLIIKKVKTHTFFIELYTDLISSVEKTTELSLFPYYEKTNVYLVDASYALNLNTDEVYALYRLYINKRKKLEIAHRAYQNMVALLKQHHVFDSIEQIPLLDKKIKVQCRNLYQIVQPYFINSSPKAKRARVLDFDNYMACVLNEKPPRLPQNFRNDLFKQLEFHIERSFTRFNAKWTKAGNLFLDYARSHFKQENERAPLQNRPKIKWTTVVQKHTLSSIKWTQEKFYPKTNLPNPLPAENNLVASNAPVSPKNKVWDRPREWIRKIHLSPLLDWMQEKLENEALDYEIRSHFLIQHTHYSKFVYEFRSDLYRFVSSFNKAMQKQLKAQTGVPFPELEDSNEVQKQSKQVIGIKHIFNSLYHFEGIIRELERLNNRSTETRYVYHLILAYTHLYQIIKSIQSLAIDPYFKFIGSTLFAKAQITWAIIQANSEPYQAYEQISNDEPIQYYSLLYTLNAFYIIPQHIKHLKSNNALTPDELKDLRLKGEKSTLIIEKIIRNSNSYFKLFLQAPQMYTLYENLKAKLNEFITTAHDRVRNNLKQNKIALFLPILLEADKWEDRVGLAPGTLSHPLKKIITEYYKGLLPSLNLSSKDHIELMSDPSLVERREQVLIKKNTHNQKYLANLEKSYESIKELQEHFKTYTYLEKGIFLIPDFDLISFKRTLIKAYKKVLPKLAWLQKEFFSESFPGIEVTPLDNFLNSNLDENQPKLTQICSLVDASLNRYERLKATYQMKVETANEKLTYFDELRKEEAQEHLLFIEDYTKAAVEKQLAEFSSRHIGLQYAYEEYNSKLRETLDTFKKDIINEAKITTDINLTIRNSLKEKVKAFEAVHFVKYYQLDKVMVALAQFKNYFGEAGQGTLFEDTDTLDAKTRSIDALIKTAKDQSQTITQRFASIRATITNCNFERIILKHKETHRLTFTWFCLCILSLLETLLLYTPTCKKLYTNLNQALPPIEEQRKRFGFFSSPTRSPAPQPIDEDSMDMGVSQL